jgi:hypothetical protein
VVQPFAFEKFTTGTVTDRKAMLLAAALVGLGLSVILTGRLALVGFSILDDHHLIGWLGPKHHLPLEKFWSTLISTEIGEFGTGARFRPVFYSILICQAWLWGDNPGGYHVVKIIWFAVFLWSVVWAAYRSIGVIAGLAIVFMVVNLKMWGDIWTYSSFVAEQPAVFGIALVVFGFGLAFDWFASGCKTRIDRALLLAGIGCLIAVGSKENFMFLLGPYLGLLAFAWWKRAVGSAALSAALVLLLLDAVICYGIIVPNWGRPTDVYGIDNSIAHRFAVLRSSPLIWIAMPSAAVGALIAVWALWSNMSANSAELRKTACVGGLLLGAGIYLAWEIFFYDGRLPSGMRYDFPSKLIGPVIAGSIFFLLAQALAPSNEIGRQIRPAALGLIFALIVVIWDAVFTKQRILPIVDSVSHAYSRTQAMMTDLGAARDLTVQHPHWPVIVSPAYPFDFEPVFTLPLWFKQAGVQNPITVLASIDPQDIKSPFERSLVDQMQSWSSMGAPGRFEARNFQVENAEAQGHCYEVAFVKPVTACVLLPYRPQAYLPIE